MIIKAFNDIPRAPSLEQEGIGGFSDLRRVAAIEVGTGAVAFKADQSGIWLGAHKWADAPFRVDMEGNVVASSATMTGYIAAGGAASDVNAGVTTISGGKITAASITADRLDTSYIVVGGAAGDVNAGATTISGGKITTNTITATQIAANTITATQMNITTLSSISANIGTITSGTITGATVRTATSGARFEISGSKGASYNSGGTELTRLDGSGLTLAGTGGNVVSFKDSMGGTEYGTMGYHSSLGLYLSSWESKNIIIRGDKDAFIYGTSGNIYVSAGDGKNVFLAKDAHCKDINLNYGQSEGDISNVNAIIGYNNISLQTGGTNKVECNANLDMKDYDIDAATTVWAYNFSNRSDRRLKQNIQPLGNVLKQVLMLNPVSFEFKKKQGKRKQRNLGFIAQDLYRVFPELVNKSSDGYLSINQTELISILIRAIQELYGTFLLSEAEKTSQFLEDRDGADQEIANFKEDEEIEFFEITPEVIEKREPTPERVEEMEEENAINDKLRSNQKDHGFEKKPKN